MIWQLYLLHFPLRFLVFFNVLVFAVVFFIISFSMVYCLGFIVIFLLLGCLTPSCVHSLNYFKEGEETFCSLNVYFPEACWGGAVCCRGERGNLEILGE